MLQHWRSAMPLSVRLVYPKRRPQFPGRYRRAHQEDLRPCSVADDIDIAFAKGPDLVDPAAHKDPWGVVEVSAGAGSLSAGVDLEDDEATMGGAEVAVERVAVAPD